MFYCMFILLVIAPLAPRFSRLMQRYCIQERSQKFVSGGGQNQGTGRKVSKQVQGQSPGGGLGTKPPEAEDIYANNQKPLFSQQGNFRGGHVPLVPLPYAPDYIERSMLHCPYFENKYNTATFVAIVDPGTLISFYSPGVATC